MATEVWGISMVRDEADILPGVLDHMTRQVDHVLVADNLSTDDTPDVLAAAGVEVVTDADPAYRQSEKMTALAARARDAGAAWVVPFDADEIWHTRDGRTLADFLRDQHDTDVVVADLFNHYTAGLDDPAVVDPVRRMTWRTPTPGALPKVACRTHPDLVIGMGNHSAEYGPRAAVLRDGLVVRHFPYRSADQFIRKARQGSAALAATRLHRSVGAHWREYGRMLANHGEDALAQHYRQHFHYPDPVYALLVCDPAPVAS